MYTRPSKAEQCLHNVLKVVEALRHIGLDYDIQVNYYTCITLFILILRQRQTVGFNNNILRLCSIK